MEADADLLEQFKGWNRLRDEFHARMTSELPRAGADKWQKHYYRGVDAADRPGSADHQTKLRLAPFTHAAEVPHRPDPTPSAALSPPASSPSVTADSTTSLALAKREWLLDSMERQRQLSNAGSTIERRLHLGHEEFLERYYAPGRPVILVGEMSDWPALSRWTPGYLRTAIGSKLIEYQG